MLSDNLQTIPSLCPYFSVSWLFVYSAAMMEDIAVECALFWLSNFLLLRYSSAALVTS